MTFTLTINGESAAELLTALQQLNPTPLEKSQRSPQRLRQSSSALHPLSRKSPQRRPQPLLLRIRCLLPLSSRSSWQSSSLLSPKTRTRRPSPLSSS